MQAEQQSELEPCPFCGAGDTQIEGKGPWNGQGYSEPISVSVRHWCPAVPGQPSRMIERIGRDRASAIEAWNRRAVFYHPSPQGWISVKDRLPVDGDETVLVADKFGNVGTGDLWEGAWDCSIEIVDGDCPGYVTHWQPYPPPPEQGSKG